MAQAGEGRVRYGDGCLWYKGEIAKISDIALKGLTYCILVVFRLVVFRPFISEVILAKVKSSDEDGIRSMSPTDRKNRNSYE